MAGPCFDFQIKQKDFDLKPEDIRPIWEFAKANYLDKGVSFEDTITQLSRETGAPPRFFAEAFSGPKSQRIKTAEIYRTESLRKRAINEAKDYIAGADTPTLVKALKAVAGFPRASLTALHGGVFPVTHGGGLLLRPSKWNAFAKGFAVSWKSISDSAYHVAKQDLLADPFYEYGRQSGLKIDPEEGPQGVLSGWLSGKEGWSKKAWLGLQRMRLEFFKQQIKGYPEEMRTIDFGKEMAAIANHATGVTNVNLGPISKTMFAPQLTASKFMRAIFDPIKTLNTFSRMSTGLGKAVTAGERAAAYKRVIGAAEFIGTTYAGLMLNQALMKAQGSKQQINFTQPLKSDWLRFKTGNGYVLATRGPEEVIRLLGHLIAIGMANKHDLYGKSPQAAAADTVSKFAQYKLHPTLQVVGEGMYGKDLFGRALPPEIQRLRGMVGLTPQAGTNSKPQYTLAEYASQKGPIFIGGGARDVYESLREQGMDRPDLNMLFRGALISAAEFTGFSAYRETEPQPKSGSSSRGSTRSGSRSQKR